MDNKALLTQLATKSLLNDSQFLVDVVASTRNLSKITVIVDGDAGITIDDCSKISQEFSRQLDEMNFGADRYVLEVTTPGLDQPLKLKRQYRKNVGRGIKVHRTDKSIVMGRLAGANEDAITVALEEKKGKVITEKEVIMPYDAIEKAFVMISFK
ncbi:MAG: ribosome maturation factor RimP [Cyclobacteriaceae bacterium]|nr:ribosome maturation factor RimP [Cyclobacteriaceae bacterium]